MVLIEYIPLQQGLRLSNNAVSFFVLLIEYIPLQQGLRLNTDALKFCLATSLSIFHYNKD